MTFDLIDWEDTMIGQPFHVGLKVVNENTLKRTVKVTLTASVVFYNGVMARMIKSESYEVKIDGKRGEFNIHSMCISNYVVAHWRKIYNSDMSASQMSAQNMQMYIKYVNSNKAKYT
jgi:hypothetical protein